MILFALGLALTSAESNPTESNASENDVFSILEEENTVSVGSRVEQKISEAASSVWVIDRDMIRLSAASNIADLLRLVPGFSILEWSNSESNIGVRTLGSQTESTVLMLVDNRPVAGVNSDVEIGMIPVAIADIERIEIIIGPASTLYGANAYTGVINIITRRPVQDGWRVYAQGQGGAGWQSVGGHSPTLGGPHPVGDGFIEYSQAMHTEHAGEFALRMSLGGTFLSTATPVDAVNNSYQYIMPPDAQRGTANIDATWSLGKWRARLTLSGVLSQNESFTEAIETLLNDQHLAANLEVNGNDLALHGDRLTLQVWYRNVKQNGNTVIPDIETSSVLIGEDSAALQAFYALPTFFWNRLTLGAEVRVASQTLQTAGQDALLPNGHFQEIYGLFAEDQFRPLDWLILNAGIRGDAQQTSAWAPLARAVASPRVSLVLLPRPEHSFRFEYASAFRNPTLIEEFITEKFLDNTVTATIPNTSLRPEQHQMASFGYQGRVGYFRGRAEAFYGYYTNAINDVLVTPGTELPLHFVNNGRSDEYGASFYADVTPTKFFRAFAHYTYAEARNLTLPAGPGRIFGTSPHHIAAVGGWLTLGRVEGGVQCYFTSDYRDGHTILPARVILNVTAGVWLDARRRVQLFAQGTNLTDTRIGGVWNKDYDDPSVMRVGPRIWLGVRLNLGSNPLL